MIGQTSLPAAYGGIERVVEELGARLVERGVDVDVFCTPEGSLPERYRGMRLIAVRRLRGKHLGKLTQSALATWAARRGGYDVVHFHAIGPCLFTPIIKWGSHAKVVATIHGRDDLRAKWGPLARRLLRIAAWMSAKVPDAVVVVSRDLQDDYLASFGRMTSYICNGVGTVPEGGPSSTLAKWAIEPRRYLLYVGRLVPEKSPHDLIAAFHDVAGDDVRLVVVGASAHTDDYAQELERLSAADPRVILAGPVYGSELHTLFAHAAVFVLPSRLEGLPVALLEAIGHELPVVVSDIEPHREVIGQPGPGGRMFRVGDRRALTTEIEATLAHLPEERVGAAERAEGVAVRYDWDRAAEETMTLYHRVLGKSL